MTRFRERGCREDADPSPFRAVPGREQIVDPLHSLVAQPGRELRRRAFRQPVRRHRTGDVLAVADRLGEHATEPGLRECRGGAADASGVLHNRGGPGANRFQRADGDHQRALLALKEAGRPHRETRGVGKPEVLVEAALEGRGKMCVAVDETREERLAASFVYLGTGVVPENRVRRSDRDDSVASNGKRRVFLHAVDRHHGRVRKDDGPARSRRRLAMSHAGLLEEHRRRAGTGRGEQLAAAEAVRFRCSMWRSRRVVGPGA